MWTETAASRKSRFTLTMLDEYIFYATINVVYKYGVYSCMWMAVSKFSVTVFPLQLTVTEKSS